MRRASISICAGIILAASAPASTALGFGSVTNTTVLGQPLAFTVPLRMDADEFVSVECVFAEVHAGDVRVPPAQVRVSLDSREGGERVLRITTSALIDEPVVSVEVGVGCPVRLSRKFVAFVDPPVISLARAPEPETPAAQTQPAPDATAAQPPSAAIIAPPPTARVARPETTPPAKAAQRRPARPVARPSVIAAPTVAPTQRARSQEPRAKVAAAAPATAGGARLKLEAAEAPTRAPMPQAAASVPATESSPATVGATEASAAVAVAAATAASANDPQQGQERERMRLLEESLARLRSDTDATRSSVAALQARLREAEASRYANPLVYALVALVLLMLLAMAMMLWWVRARDRQRADWWAASAEGAEAARQRPAAPAAGPPSVHPSAPDSVSPMAVVDSLPAPAGAATWKPTLAIPELDKNEVPKRAVTAEELIDLEQQAEFFITLGQDDSAIDLLVGHLNSSGGISPLPYLKLMEVHRRRGDLSAYERIREHFNQRFNAYAPAGDAYSAPARTLDEHPDVMAQLQEAWPTPARAMGLLESLLFKPGGRDAAFDLAAYREVLFLHEVARDLYEHDSSPSTVDVLLPLDTQAAALAANPLMTTMSVPANPDFGRSSGVVDLDLGRPRDEEAEAAAARAERRKERYGDGDFLFGSHTGGEWDKSNSPGKGGGRKGSK